MLTNLKALVVILAISSMVFALAKPLCLRHMDAVAFIRRRNIWFTLTIVAFVSPSFWLYVLVAAPLIYWAAKKDTNPLALYVLLIFAIPKMTIYIPTIGIGQLFDLNQHRLLSLALLVPLLFRNWNQYSLTATKRLGAIDWFIVFFCVLQIILQVPYESITNTFRRALLLFLDIFVVFYLFARLDPKEKVIREILMMFWLVCMILACIAVFESFRGWLLYTGLGQLWGAPNIFAFLMRGESLRAQASTGHSLSLGFHLAIGIGFWLYLSRYEPKLSLRLIPFGVMLAGIIVTYSRGGLLTAVFLYLLFLAFRANALKSIMKAAPLLALVVAVAYLSPLKESVIDRLPIVGTEDQGNIDYRQQVAEVSWRVIKMNPFFGDPFAFRNLGELRQGQGIIDIVNGYAYVALFNGLVGLALFIIPFVVSLGLTWRAAIHFRKSKNESAQLGAALIACLLASMFFIATAGTESAVYWIMGLMTCFGSMTALRAPSTAPVGAAMDARR